MFGVHKKKCVMDNIPFMTYSFLWYPQTAVVSLKTSFFHNNKEQREVRNHTAIFYFRPVIWCKTDFNKASILSVLSCDNILQYLNTSNNQMLIFARCKNAHTKLHCNTGLKVQVHVFSHIVFWRCAHWHNASWRICSFFFSAPMSVKRCCRVWWMITWWTLRGWGTSNYYWAFPSKALHARKRRLEELERQVRASLFGIWHCISDSWLVK